MIIFRYFLSAALLALSVTNVAPADDKPAKPERHMYRIIGLFSPDREKDLRAGFAEMPDIKLVGVNFDDAEITVELIPSKVFPGAKTEQLVQALDQKVRQATRHTFGVKPRRDTPREKLKQVVIPVAGLDCKACCLAAYEAIANIDGVYQATASFKEGRITALIDPAKTNIEMLSSALRSKGVKVGNP
jgi:copper chaperone CopZ